MRSRNGTLLVLTLALAAFAARGQAPTPASAAASAAAAVPTAAQIRSYIGLGSQQDKFGTYAPGSNEPLFSGGRGNATPQGTARKAACVGNTTDPECFAIQALQNGRANPTTWVPLNGPQLTGRNTVVSDPTAVLGVDPAAIAGASSTVQCRTETLNTPEVREENHCYVSTPNSTVSCSLAPEVIVDPDYIYKCLIRIGTNTSTACSVGQVVTVDSTTTYRCIERLRSNQPNSCLATRVVEVQADTNYQCIDQARTVANAACTVGQVVTIDPHFNYTCTNTPNAVTTNYCNRKLTVTCTDGPACSGVSATWEPIPGQAAPSNVTFSGTTSPAAVTMRVDYDASLGNIKFRVKFTANPMWTSVTFGAGPGTPLTNVYINGVLARNPFLGQPSVPNGIVVGWNNYEMVVPSAPVTPTPSVFFQGMAGTTLCTQPPATCTDSWDESACAPYRDRV